MKNIAFVLAAILAAAALFALVEPNRPAMAANETKPAGVRHVVLFKFRDSATPENIATVEKAFAALPRSIDLIRGFEWGTNISPENLSQGYTHCFLLTFDSPRDRDAYLVHPAHKEFGRILGPYLEKVAVIDYEPKSH